MSELIEIISSMIVPIISIIVSVLLVIVQINKNANEQLKASLAENRPLIIASIYGRMDMEGRSKRREKFTRYIVKTPLYQEFIEKNKGQKQECAFLRVRNESESHAHGISINLQISDEKGKVFQQEYTINMIASFSEYLFFVPKELKFGDYFYKFKVVVSYSSISGERIHYVCEYNHQNNHISNVYEGKYKIRDTHMMKTFELQTLADSLETIEIYTHQENEN